jgi:hypothetical protein
LRAGLRRHAERLIVHSEIETRLPHLYALCGKHRVARLDLFGSGTGEEFEPSRSDVDSIQQSRHPLCGERASVGLAEVP